MSSAARPRGPFVIPASVLVVALLVVLSGTAPSTSPDGPASSGVVAGPAEDATAVRGSAQGGADRGEARAPRESWDLAVPEGPGAPRGEAGSAAAPAAGPRPPSGPVAPPVRIEIPAIAVDAQIVPVGLLADGAMEVPDFGLAGWYKLGPRPGEAGPAAVVAHVDSRAGPDVFFRLRELVAGDAVRVHRENGSVVTFEVERQEQTPKDELPTDRIWGWTDEPTLRLLTCDGFFDRATGHYVDNRIVYLSLAPDAPE